MRVAVCISGEIRTLDVDMFKSIFKNVDFFIHTNEYDDRISILNPKSFLVEDIDFNIHPYFMINNKSNYNDIKNSPKRVHNILTLDEFKNINDNKFEIENPGLWSSKPFNVLSMYYSVMQSNLLKKNYEQINGFVYDVVIRIRPDMVFPNGFVYDNYDFGILNVFNTPLSIRKVYVNDHFAISNSKTMDIYSLIYNYIPKYYYIDNIDFIPEILLKHHLDEFNINYNENVVPYIVKRSDGRKDVYMNI